MKIGDNFTKEDLVKVDFDKMNEKGLHFKSYDSYNNYNNDDDSWWNEGFSLWLKDGKNIYIGINPRKDEGFILKSNKYGEFKVSFLGKILADFMNDNNEIYIINRELKKVGEKHGWEADVDDGYFANERFCYIILHNLYYDWSDIIKKVLEMAIERKEFIKIIQTFEEWEYFLQENKYESA